jgi:hypothetical protein
MSGYRPRLSCGLDMREDVEWREQGRVDLCAITREAIRKKLSAMPPAKECDMKVRKAYPDFDRGGEERT